jgi:hypothetical protein
VKKLAESFTAELSERREHPRFSVEGDSVVVFVGQGVPLPGHIIDLSQEGCCIRTSERCSARVQRPVDVGFKVNGSIFRFSGILQWTNGRDLLGIQFVNMIPRRMVELANMICEMEAGAAARSEAVGALVSEHEASPQAEREIVQKDRSGDRPNSQSFGHGAIKMADTRDQSAVSPTPRDRRRSLRHEVDTSATVFLVNVGSTLRGRIVDLSMSGCRICTDERFPVGIYTRVETEFRLEGLPFRLGGVIQAIHDRQMVGIRFLDLSERKRQQVSDLIDEIEESRAALMPRGPNPAPVHN